MKKFCFLFLIICGLMVFCLQDCQARQKLNLADLENKYNAVIGVYAVDMENGKKICYKPDTRFSYCSTHKVFTAAELLRQKNTSDLNEIRKFSAEDILSYAPITKDHVADGMTLAEICSASLRWSDNTAANLILQEIGGVENFKVALKNIGDQTTKPARNEPELNLFNPKDNRDTSTPRQMVKNLQVYIFGDILSDDKKKLLIDWMSDNSITDTLIKAETPQGWKVIDKSGSGDYGARNDIAVIYPPNRKPIVMAIMSRRTEKNAKSDDAMIAEAAKRIFDNLVF